jgi:hypothetical protein
MKILVTSIILALLLATIPVLTISNAQVGTITIAVDLGHGEKDKYLNYIMGNITQVTIDGKTYSVKWVTYSEQHSYNARSLGKCRYTTNRAANNRVHTRRDERDP